jgi:hypothetical protein
MNQKKVKLIRKMVYRKEAHNDRTYKTINNGQVICSCIYRPVYQNMKQECRNMSLGQIKIHLRPRKKENAYAV